MKHCDACDTDFEPIYADEDDGDLNGTVRVLNHIFNFCKECYPHFSGVTGTDSNMIWSNWHDRMYWDNYEGAKE